MGFSRLLKKSFLGGNLVTGHIIDALDKKKKTGRTFKDCLEESVKETFTEDLPGTKHLYKMGHTDGKKEGTAEQAKRDEKKIQEIHFAHQKDREEWKRIDKEKDDLIDELGNNLD